MLAGTPLGPDVVLVAPVGILYSSPRYLPETVYACLCFFQFVFLSSFGGNTQEKTTSLVRKYTETPSS